MKWRKKYILFRLRHIKHFTREMLRVYDEMVANSEKCKNSNFNRFDFLCSYLMFGAEAEDYFSYGFYEHRNPFFRNHHVTRGRLNFAKELFNSDEGMRLLISKSDFNNIFDKYLGRKWCCPNTMDEKSFVNKMVAENMKVFVKVLDGFGGKGAFITSSDSENLSKIYKELTEGKAKYIVEEYIDQKGFFRDVNPSSLNTVRVTTVRVGQNIYPVFSYLRAGGPNSIVDNLHSGGVRYVIDVQTGIIQKGINYRTNNIEIHPSSGVKVAGYKIPQWNKIVEYAKTLQENAPAGANLVGWDLCVSDDNIYVIEGNESPGFPQEIRFSDNTWKKVKKYLKEL